MPDPDLSPAESERRVATVLFADISGFTSLSEKLEPEAVTELMNVCFEAIGAIAEGHGGVVDKFIGDCAMLLFGAPAALEHAPRESLHAALEIREAIEGLNRERRLPEPIAIHIGVNSGTVVAGSVGSSGRKSYTVMGDPVNVASRLKDRAGRGEILVGHDTWAEARRDFLFGDARSVEVKGKELQVEARALLGCGKAAGTGGCPDLERLSPLVGRDAELRALELRALETEEGRGSMVFLVGEPGIGISRLLAELLGSKAAGGCLRLEGRCHAQGRTMPFHPVVEALRRWAGIKEDDDEASALLKLEAAVASVAAEELGEIYPFVARLLGYSPSGLAAERLRGIEGEALESLVGKNIRALFARIAVGGPLIVAIEDLHWADDSTIGLLEGIAALAEGGGVCFFLTMRPDFAETGERLLGRLRERWPALLKVVDLEPLGAEDSGRLLDGILAAGGFPPALRARIVERSDGNPYFIEEVLRSLVDEGAITLGPSGWEASAGLEERQVPSTIQEVLMARIDRLDEKTRSLVRMASVIGRSFSYRVLSEVATSIDEIEGKILHLTEIQLLLRGGRLDELEYLFKHALAQEVAYESLLANKRRELHRAVASAVERLFPDRSGEFAGMLAWHYARAEDFERAEEYMVRAGEEAMRSAASQEALTYYLEAFELYRKKRGASADPGKVAAFEANIAKALYCKGDYEEALPHYERALDHLRPLVPGSRLPRMLQAILGLLGTLAWSFGLRGPGRRPPDDAERDYIALDYEKAQVLANINGPAFAIDTLALARICLRLDLSSCEAGKGLLVALPTLFAYGGLSLGLGRRCILRAKPMMPGASPEVALMHHFTKALYDFCVGAWSRPASGGDPVFRHGLERGCLPFATATILFEGHGYIERGDREGYAADIASLGEIAERFADDDARYKNALLEGWRLVKERRQAEAALFLPAQISWIADSGLKREGVPNLLSFAVRAALLSGDLPKAEATLAEAERLEPGPKGSPYREGFFLGARTLLALERLVRSSSHAPAVSPPEAGARPPGLLPRNLRREAFAAARAYLSNSRKMARDRPEAQRLLGNAYWHLGKRRAALAWWRRSIASAEGLGARVDLAHSLHDAGCFLAAEAPGPEWRERAERLYEELGLREAR